MLYFLTAPATCGRYDIKAPVIRDQAKTTKRDGACCGCTWQKSAARLDECSSAREVLSTMDAQVDLSFEYARYTLSASQLMLKHLKTQERYLLKSCVVERSSDLKPLDELPTCRVTPLLVVEPAGVRSSLTRSREGEKTRRRSSSERTTL